MIEIQPKPKRIEACLKHCGSGDEPNCEACWYLGFRDCKGDLLKDAYHYVVNIKRVVERIEKQAMQIAAAQPKWISVKDNSPDGTKDVIACNMYGEMLIGHVLAMSNGKEYYCETLQDNIYCVTHWMPRPEAPKT